jgi:hypothetical protein
LNALEIAVEIAAAEAVPATPSDPSRAGAAGPSGGAPGPPAGAPPRVTLEHAREALQAGALRYDRAGEEHFNLISALHKSLRASDAQGAVYWTERMLAAGEDPLYVARRLVRMA